MSSSNGGITKIGGYSEGHLLAQAKRVVANKSFPIFDIDAENRIPKFDTNELTIGRVLGRGGFCKVSEVVEVALKSDSGDGDGDDNEDHQDDHNDEHQLANIVQDRDFMQAHFLRKGKDYRYAIKKLKEDAVKDVQTFINGIVDLAIEARFLAVIRHPNIIKMRAISSGTPYSRDYFVVLDRLYDILSRTLTAWKRRKGGGLKKMLDRGGRKSAAFWVERITVAHDLGCALKYLHSLGVIYRDLKPDNVGFDVRGDVKIFDFGLSRQLPPQSEKLKDGTYKMTGDTGSPRYMAPEVALEKSYNETSDVYSFGILLHQMCSMETPYEGYTMKMFEKKVVIGGTRPKLDPKWPPCIQKLLLRCWHVDIKQRPSMNEVVNILREDLADHTDEEIRDILDASNKSQKSLHGYMKSQAAGR